MGERQRQLNTQGSVCPQTTSEGPQCPHTGWLSTQGWRNDVVLVHSSSCNYQEATDLECFCLHGKSGF